MSNEDNFDGQNLTVSKLQPYSYGIVAANKLLSSKNIEVTPIEDLPMLDGELTDSLTKKDVQGKDAQGASYHATISASVSINATWLPMGSSNRMTAPDVRRGETVMLYRYANSDKYFWTTLKDDLNLRKLETVIWAFSATQVESDTSKPDTTYFFEISTHKKLIHLHTSTANGEQFGYDIQLDTDQGQFVLMDTDGNYISVNSKERRIEMMNSDGSHYDMNGSNLTMTIPGNVKIDTETFELNAKSSAKITSVNTLVDSKLEVTKITSLDGGFISGANSTGGPNIVNGQVKFNGQMQASGISSTSPITAPNIR